MKLRRTFGLVGIFCANLVICGEVMAFGGRLSPRDFNKMYYLASAGKVGILRDAVNRGLNIDAVNPNGDTGLCIAIKRKNYVAYNSFRMSGANPRHACTYEINKEYADFLNNSKAVGTKKIAGNEESLYFSGYDWEVTPWFWGGLLAGGAYLAFSGGGGGGGGSYVAPEQDYVQNYGDGLATVVLADKNNITSGGYENNKSVLFENPNANSVLGKIQLLPDVMKNGSYLSSYAKVSNGAYFNNLKDNIINVGNASIGVAVTGKGSNMLNNGKMEVNAQNGSIGVAVSNQGVATNNPEGESDYRNGSIHLVFKGAEKTDSVIGMYADTSSKIVNNGLIDGVTSKAEKAPEIPEKGENSQSGSDTDIPVLGETVELVNSGSLVGMALFDLYTGKDLSMNTVTADNYGDIRLSAGYNSAENLSVALTGMGSYIDEEFLNGRNDPKLAEKMRLNNHGNISLLYQGTYNINEKDLKFGKGGLIAMRADAVTEAVNKGNINIDMTSITEQSGKDLAAGMLSVHGGILTNGDAEHIYDGVMADKIGVIKVVNEASLKDVSYGMLAAKGDGLQTKIYLNDPKLVNYGLVDMQASNSYGMASFAGGEIVNSGVINLGVERGQSRYTNNYGLYAAGDEKTKEVKLLNQGIINVNSELSYALYNAFSGAVEMKNGGDIYISSKATGSQVFGGAYSSAYNSGNIYYEVGNSGEITAPTEGGDSIINAVNAGVGRAAIDIASQETSTKQLFTNDGLLSIGDEYDSTVDYGGTYQTAGVKVSRQGSAVNNGTIQLNKYLKDAKQYNVGMYLSGDATAEAYVTNKGDIKVDSTSSIGIKNDSKSNAKGINLGSIYVNGDYSVGMVSNSVGAQIFNGLDVATPDNVSSIYAIGKDSVAMFTKDKAYNYGNIYLKGENAVAFVLSGPSAEIHNEGQIFVDPVYKGNVFYGITDGANKVFDYPAGIEVEGYILARVFGSGKAQFSGDSTAYVKGVGSKLFVAEGDKSEVLNQGSVNVSAGGVGMQAKEKGKIRLIGNRSILAVNSKDAVGVETIGAEASVELNAQVNINNGGTGIKGTASLDNVSKIKNAAFINVNDGIGIHASGQNSVGEKTAVTNDEYAVIDVKSGANKAIYLENGASFSGKVRSTITLHGNANCRDGACLMQDYAYGVYADGGSIDNGGKLYGDREAGTVGIYVENYGELNNLNDGEISGLEIGVYSGQKARVVNEGKIIDNNIGIKVDGSTVENKGLINKNSKGVVITQGTFTNSSGQITGNDIGVHVLGGGFTNNGMVEINNYGVYVDGGIAINSYSGTIKGQKDKDAIYVANGKMVNQGKIDNNGGTAVHVTGNGAFSNEGIIDVGGGIGVLVDGSGASAINTKSGVINYKDGLAYHVINGGSFVNGGTINPIKDNSRQASTTQGRLDLKVSNATFLNKGSMSFGDNAVNFDNITDNRTGQVIVGDGGTFKAESFEGEVVSGRDIVMNSFKDTYVNENSFEGKNNGLSVRSDSYMFDAKLNTKEDVTDVELNRKHFEELIEDKEIADFFETNYQLQNNQKMFNALKSASTKDAFEYVKNSETGEGFYANLSRENMAVLRGINSMEQNRLLNEGVTQKAVGVEYYRTGKDGYDGLSSYDDDVYSAFLSGGEKVNKNWSYGGTLRLSYADSTYDDINSNRDNKILMAFLPIMYQNGNFKFLAIPELGIGYGTYNRKAVSDTYEADTLDLYYGAYNHAEYSIDMKVAELVTEAELNLQGMKMTEAKEKDGLKLRSADVLSVEVGIGVKLRKKLQLAKERSLMLAIGTKYYQELADPYEDIEVGMSGSPLNLPIDGYNEDKSRLKTTAEALYKDGDFAVSAEISHNAEKKSNVEGGVGIRYNF